MSKINVNPLLPPLYIGAPEFQRMVDLLEKTYSLLEEAMIVHYGFNLANLDTDIGWKATSDLASLNVVIQPGRAILKDTNGIVRGIVSTTEKTIVSGASGGLFWVLLEYATQSEEAGTVEVTNGSTGVVGTGTEFTKILAPNRSLIVGSLAYVIQSVEDDEHLTLVDPFPGSSDTGLQFSVGGWFKTAIGTSDEMKIYQHDAFNLVIQSGLPSYPTQIPIARITVSGGIITAITDSRATNIFRLLPADVPKSGIVLANSTPIVLSFTIPYPDTNLDGKGSYNVTATGENSVNGEKVEIEITQTPGLLTLTPDTYPTQIRFTITPFNTEGVTLV